MSARSVTLVISNIAWGFVWQRHQTMASMFTRDADVIFCEVLGIRRVGWRDLGRIVKRLWSLQSPAGRGEAVPAGLRVVRPLLLPASNRSFCAVNAWLLRHWLRRQPELTAGVELIWNYSASRSARWLVENVRHVRLVYDCTDDWLAVRGIPRCLLEDERALMARADFTFVPSRTLAMRKERFARRLVRLPHGALIERFLTKRKERSLEDPITLLYYGHLHSQHLDFAAIDAIALARPLWRILLVGPIKTPHAFPRNVLLVGQLPHAALRSVVARADVLVLPYALNNYTQAVLPAKIYECLATGRPVVAAPLPELVTDFSDNVQFAGRPEDWVSVIEQALHNDTAASAANRVRLATENSWDHRYQQIRELLKSASAEPVTTSDRRHHVLSVVIVAYKSRGEIAACVASLPRELDGRSVEVCVVDNSPGDGTGDILRAEFPWVTYATPRENLGFGRANNLGFARTNRASEFVLFLNPDTVCNVAALEHCVARLSADRSIGLISPKLVLADGSMDMACRRSIPTLWDGFCRASGLAARFSKKALFSGYNLTHLPSDGTYEVGAINGAFMLAPRRVLAAVAPDGAIFDDRFFMYGDDLDLCIRVARAGWKIVYDGAVSITHVKGVSVAKEYGAMSQAIFDANREVYLKHFNPSGSRVVRWKYTLAFGLWKRVALLRAKARGHRAVRPV